MSGMTMYFKWTGIVERKGESNIVNLISMYILIKKGSL